MYTLQLSKTRQLPKMYVALQLSFVLILLILIYFFQRWLAEPNIVYTPESPRKASPDVEATPKFKSKQERLVWKCLRKYFPDTPIEVAIRPDWLVGFRGRNLELDFYLPDLRFAVEVQGEQHFNPRSFQGTNEKFSAAYARDNHKIAVCTQKGINLFHVLYFHSDQSLIIKQLREEFERSKRLDLLELWPANDEQ